MKKIISLAALAAVSYTGFMLAELPAAFVWNHAPKMPEVKLEGLSGSVWSGSAQTLTVNGIELEDVSWDLRPSALLTGKIKADLEVGDNFSAVAGQATVTYSLQGMTIEDLEADASAGWLQQFASMPVPATARGNINLVADSLIYEGGQCVELDGRMEWERGRISSPLGEVKLGQADADLSCKGNTLEGNIRQSSEFLTTDAVFSVNLNGSYSLSGKVSDGEALPETIKDGMKFLGRPDAQGRYPLTFRGRI
ncbi:type II secretion system protein N [Endozoicomonas sp. 4G]|uniref:type II secretion system protein N n=1 Tax=Endozoicomonas sp. 4G TaxID=2872754 RepID=UPI00207913DF|nr:type II secretion system protein N [Endozoicomonas sp. 4G]